MNRYLITHVKLSLISLIFYTPSTIEHDRFISRKVLPWLEVCGDTLTKLKLLELRAPTKVHTELHTENILKPFVKAKENTSSSVRSSKDLEMLDVVLSCKEFLYRMKNH